MAGKRKNYSAEFKAKVALEAIRGDATVAELVAKHGVHQTVINTWKRQAIEGMAGVFSGKVLFRHIPQRTFLVVVLVLSAASAVVALVEALV